MSFLELLSTAVQELTTDHKLVLDFTGNELQNAQTCSNAFKDKSRLPFYDAVCDFRTSRVYSITYWKGGIHHVCIVEESLESFLSECNNLQEKKKTKNKKQKTKK